MIVQHEKVYRNKSQQVPLVNWKSICKEIVEILSLIFKNTEASCGHNLKHIFESNKTKANL